MLLLHEVHRVMGDKAETFEDIYRSEVRRAVAGQKGARLLWYFHHAMGSGPSYNVVTITALADGSTWEDYAEAATSGDLAACLLRLDQCRYEVVGKLLQPVSWSPMQEIALEEVPVSGGEREPVLYMEDTGWPTAPLDDYIEYWDTDYYQVMKAQPRERQLLEIAGCFQTAFGSHLRPEAILLQRILDHRALGALLTSTQRYDPESWPGSYMHGALTLRDQWESRLLRSSVWSPLP